MTSIFYVGYDKKSFIKYPPLMLKSPIDIAKTFDYLLKTDENTPAYNVIVIEQTTLTPIAEAHKRLIEDTDNNALAKNIYIFRGSNENKTQMETFASLIHYEEFYNRVSAMECINK